MMKNLLAVIIPIILSFRTQAQIKSAIVLKDTNYLYTDTINKKVYYGDYEPTSLLKAQDGGCIISTQFSIYFPQFTNITQIKNNPEIYAQSVKSYYPKTHVSSGSIFKLNRLYEKDWEIVFKEKRVKQILRYDDTSFIGAGERTDQKYIWVARINSGSGKIIWFKEFSAKRNPGIEGLSIAFNKDIIILSESERLIPLSIRKEYGRTRFVFFDEPENRSRKAMVLNIGSNGHLNWKRNLRINRKYNLFDEGVSTDSTISIISTYSTKKYRNEFGDFNFVYDLTGKKLLKQTPETNGIYLTNINGWIYSTTSSDTIHITKYDNNMRKKLLEIL